MEWVARRQLAPPACNLCGDAPEGRSSLKTAHKFWIGATGKLSVFAVLFITQYLYGNWLASIGLAAVWTLFFVIQLSRVLNRLEMPIHIWKILARRFPRGIRVTSVDADMIGEGTLNGCPLVFELIAREGALNIRLGMVAFLWRNTIAVPWNQIRIHQVGTNHDEKYVAVVSFPEFPDCEMVLPWLKRFARFHDLA